MPIDYSKQRILLLDSSGNMRATLKDMLGRMGFSQVNALPLSRSIFAEFENAQYDIVLISHNATDAYTGLQFLEEARFRGLMGPLASWVLMSGDSSQQSLLFAVEEEPDDVLIKPFSTEELRQRLDILCRRRLALEPIARAIARNAPNRAIQLCDTEFDKSHTYYDHAQLLKARLLLEQEQYAEAEPIFNKYYWRDKALRPGYMLAQCWFHQGRLVEAQSLLEAIIREHHLMIAAYDLLSRVHEVQGHLEDAKNVLMEAVRRSPLVIRRQMEVGRVLTRTENLDQAQAAYRKSIHLGETSCHAKPEAFLQLANVQRLKLKYQSREEQKKSAKDIEQVLSQAVKRFPDNPVLETQSALMMATVCDDIQAPDLADQHRAMAEKIIKENDLVLDLDETLDAMLEPAVPAAPEYQDKGVVESKADPVMSAKVNRIGVRHYLAGKHGQAIRYFGSAFEHDSSNGLALLNLAQLFLEAARDNPERSDDRLKMFDRYLRLAQRLELTPEAKVKLEQLVSLSQMGLADLPKGPLTELLK